MVPGLLQDKLEIVPIIHSVYCVIRAGKDAHISIKWLEQKEPAVSRKAGVWVGNTNGRTLFAWIWQHEIISVTNWWAVVHSGMILNTVCTSSLCWYGEHGLETTESLIWSYDVSTCQMLVQYCFSCCFFFPSLLTPKANIAVAPKCFIAFSCLTLFILPLMLRKYRRVLLLILTACCSW